MFFPLWLLNITSWLVQKACFSYEELSSVLLKLNLCEIHMYLGTEQENKIECLNKLKRLSQVILNSKHTSNATVVWSFFLLLFFFFWVTLRFCSPLQEINTITPAQMKPVLLFSLCTLMESQIIYIQGPSFSSHYQTTASRIHLSLSD